MKDSDLLSPAIRALSSVLLGVAEPAEVLGKILDVARAQTEADRGVFVEVDDAGRLSFRVLYRMTEESLGGPAGEYSRSIFEDVITHQQPVRLDDALNTTRYADAESVRALRFVSVLCMPLVLDGKVAGLIHLECSRRAHFRSEHQRLVADLLELAAPVFSALRASGRLLEERRALREAAARSEVEVEQQREVLNRDWSFGRFIGRSEPVRRLENKIRKTAATDFPVLLLGETGSGKGVLARVLHHAGKRAAGPFVTVFAPSLQRDLVESELFGHVRGAFTGADSDRPGKIEAAAGGTLFLDEIGELPLEIQPKILRLLQEKTFERTGDPRERTADVRIIAATHRDLEDDVRRGRFRRDLFERLNFVPIVLPALRDRREDIPLLLRHALDRIDGGRWITWSREVERQLVDLDYLWPGNVRQIEQLAVRLVLETEGNEADWKTMSAALGAGASSSSAGEIAGDVDRGLEQGLPFLMRQTEKRWLEEALAKYSDLTRKELAGKLRISEAGLYKKLKDHGL